MISEQRLSRRGFLDMGLMAGAALGAGGLLTACDGAAGPGHDTGPVGAHPSGTLSIVSWGAATDHTSIRKIVNRYMKAFPKVTVKFTTGDCGIDIGACKKLIAGGTMPDVMVPHNSVLEAYAQSGVLTDLTPLIRRDEVAMSQFVTATHGGVTSRADGHVYALPMGYHVETMYYNKAMFDRAGLSYPPADGNYTYDDVRQWGLRLTLDKQGNDARSPKFDPKNIVQWGFYTAPMGTSGYDPILLAWGGSLLDPKNSRRCELSNGPTVRAFQFIQDLMWKDHVAVTPQLDAAQAGKYRFAANHVAMLSGAHWMTDIMIAQAPHLPYDVAPLPQGPAGHGSVVNVHGWGVYKGSSNVELAWHFVKWAATTGAGPAMGLIPAYRPIIGRDFLNAPHQPAHLKEAFIVPASWSTTISPPEFGPNYAELIGQDGIGPALTDIYFDKKPASKALAGSCKTVSRVIG